jgi:hypothetical protein
VPINYLIHFVECGAVVRCYVAVERGWRAERDSDRKFMTGDDGQSKSSPDGCYAGGRVVQEGR